ncbi:MAG: hypothetical protein Ct9H300mP16_00550 [Pseudomonadota bacterium]|nr:MAG: hypothetical protein Ct9H300mP16_00550 [Pseudomonadota bacterium]
MYTDSTAAPFGEECSAGKDRELISDVREFLDRQKRVLPPTTMLASSGVSMLLAIEPSRLRFRAPQKKTPHPHRRRHGPRAPVNGFSQSVTGTGISPCDDQKILGLPAARPTFIFETISLQGITRRPGVGPALFR